MFKHVSRMIWLLLWLCACAPMPTGEPTPLVRTPTAALTPAPTIRPTDTPASPPTPLRTPPSRPQATATVAPARTATPSARATATAPAECAPTEQDEYVYFDFRFRVMAACVRVVGVVRRAFVNQGDGDGLIDLALDAPYRRYLSPSNAKVVNGYLHMEIACYGKPPYKESYATSACEGNPHPVREPLPKVGQRIWAEGRWVQDVFHEEIAELHPVYRWGVTK